MCMLEEPSAFNCMRPHQSVESTMRAYEYFFILMIIYLPLWRPPWLDWLARAVVSHLWYAVRQVFDQSQQFIPCVRVFIHVVYPVCSRDSRR